MDRVDAGFLGKFWCGLPDEDVLYYYDGPLAFVVRHGGRMFFANQADEWRAAGDWVYRFLVREVVDADIYALRAGNITLREFILGGPSLWIVDEAPGGLVVYSVKPEAVPDEYLPKAGVTLYRPEGHARFVAEHGAPK